MRVYRPPQFNDVCRIWLDAFPPSLAQWDGFPPDRPADITSVCQVYRPREGFSRLLHAISDDAESTFLRSGAEELRLPKGTPLRTTWGVSPSTTWAESALVEVSAGSGRLYVVTLAETKHRGFPNEYVVGVLAQLRSVGLARPARCGMTVTATRATSAGASQLALGMGGGARIKAPGGINIDTSAGGIPTWWFPLSWVTWVPLGSAATAAAVALQARRHAGVGAGVFMKTTSGVGESPLALGTAATAVVTKGPELVALGVGTAAEMATTFSPGAPTGGPTCETASLVAIPSTTTFVAGSGAVKWFKADIPAMGPYKVTVRRTQGNNTTVTLMYGVCPSPGSWDSFTTSTSGFTCRSSNLNPGTLFVKFNGPASSSTYELKVETGTC